MSKYINDLSKNIVRTQVNDNMEKVFNMNHDENAVAPDPLPRNQTIKKGRGGPRVNSGRKKGAIQKLGGADLLLAIANETGKSFAENIAEHYNRAIHANEWHDVRDYEKFIIAKVISDRHEIQQDVTSNGQTLGVQLVFTSKELPEWKKE